MHGPPASGTAATSQSGSCYRYTDAGPAEWAPRMRALTEDTALTHVLVNTCDRDNAQANAHQRALLQS
jgi:uncharacterized protein YecE (DUF72 family)